MGAVEEKPHDLAPLENDQETFDPGEHEQSEAESLREARAIFDRIEGTAKPSGAVATPERDDSSGNGNGQEDSALYERSYRALRRAKVPGNVLEGLSKEQIMSWGKDLAPVHDEVDRAFSERESLRRQLSQADTGAAEESDEVDPDQGVPNFDVTLDDKAVTPVMEAMGLSGESGAKAVQMLTKLIVGAVGGKVGEALKLRASEVQKLQGTLVDVAGHVARQELGKRFPKLLEDSETWEKVQKKARGFVKGGEYQRAEDAWHDAARLVVGEPVSDSSENGRQDVRRQRSNDLPSTRSVNGGVQSKPLTRMQQDRIAFEWLDKHPRDTAGAKAAVERARQMR